MAITNHDSLISALGNTQEYCTVAKNSITSQLTGGFSSLWRATGIPGQGSIPTTAEICTKSLAGVLKNFTSAGSGDQVYVGRANLYSNVTSPEIFLQDRLAHMGGLSGTTIVDQTVAVDLSSLAGTRCATDYSDVRWWLEIYTAIGTSGQTATITYTDANDASGKTVTLTIGGASPANQPARLFPIIPTDGIPIKYIDKIQHASTGTAGNYGITATKEITSFSLANTNLGVTYDWATLGLPPVHNDACLFFTTFCVTTATGFLGGTIRLING